MIPVVTAINRVATEVMGEDSSLKKEVAVEKMIFLLSLSRMLGHFWFSGSRNRLRGIHPSNPLHTLPFFAQRPVNL